MKLKKYIPYENYNLTTELTLIEVNKRLSYNIELRQKNKFTLFNNYNTTKPYIGEYNINSFCINRIINYRNSFLPIIKGEISTTNNLTHINIKMRPKLIVTIFMTFWLSIIGIICLGVLIIGIINSSLVLKEGFSPFILIPFGMFIFGYLLFYKAFKFESKKSKEFLNNLFDIKG